MANEIETYKETKENLRNLFFLFGVIGLFMILFIIINYPSGNFSALIFGFAITTIVVFPLIYIFKRRICSKCAKKMTRKIKGEMVIYYCDNCKTKMILKIGLTKDN